VSPLEANSLSLVDVSAQFSAQHFMRLSVDAIRSSQSVRALGLFLSSF
jgi:hypothetical protein